MTKNSSELKSIDDLHVLKLEDKERYASYAKHTSCPFNCWWAQFPYFWSYSLTGKRQSLWAIVDGLFVPFLFSGRYLSLLTIPFGEGDPEKYLHVLKQCFDFCSRQNGTNQDMTHARWVTEDQVQFLKRSGSFGKFFHAQQLTLGPEYHFGIRALLELEGKEFEGVRRKRNKFLKKHPDIIIREYLSADADGALELHTKWSEDAQKRYSDIFDETYYPAFLEEHKNFDHIILVAVHNNSIVGLISGSLTPDDQSYCYLRKALLEYDGLSEMLLLHLVQAIHEKDNKVRFLNDGGTGQKPGMVAFKQRFRPELLVNRYRLHMNVHRILQKTTYRGPSIAGYFPAARLVIESSHHDLFQEMRTPELDLCQKLLNSAFDTDAEGMEWELEKSPAGILAQVAVLVQRASRHPVRKYSIRRISPSQAEICFELLRPDLLETLVECLTAFWRSGILGFDPLIFIDQYRSKRKILGFTLQEYIVWDRVRTAQLLGIPARPDEGFRVWLGRGSARRLTSLGYTQNTPRLAKTIAGDKSLSHSYLMKKGLPLPQQKVVRDEKAALRAANQIGYPVVLKPRQGNKGEGVAVNLTSDKDVSKAYRAAKQIDRKTVVESFVDGEDFRFLVINGRFIAAVKRIPAHVIGDGLHSIRELMDAANHEERRDGLFLYPLKIDQTARTLLREQGLGPDSLPTEGQHVLLRLAANVSLGGTIEDVTDLVHPDNRAAAIAAAETCLLDVAGIDFKTTDISRSWRDGYGRIIEINSGPGVELHMEPTIGQSREVTRHLVRSHFPSHRKEPSPLVVISGRYGKESVAHHCAGIWSQTGITPGLLLKDRLVTGSQTMPVPKLLYSKMDILERHTECDAAVVTLSMGTILQEGICTDSFSCAVLTDDLADEQLGLRHHDPLATDKAWQLLADMATHGAVIDGTSSRLYDALRYLPANHVIMAWPEPYHSLPHAVQAHLERGGRAIGIRTDKGEPGILTWYEHDTARDIAPVSLESPHGLKSLLMAVAADIAVPARQEELLSYLSAPAKTGALKSLNSLITDRCAKRRIQAASADPADSRAQEEFFSKVRTGDTIYLVASDKPGISEEWQKWNPRLEATNVFYMLETDPANPSTPQAAHRAQLFGTIEEAWQLAIDLAGEDDTILLLTKEHPIRRKFFRYFQDRLASSSSSDRKMLWQATELAELFQGTWISGRDSGWGVNRIGWGRDMIGPDTVTILPGPYPELTADLAPMEKELEETFQAGAFAAISAVHSPLLPRWTKVMQTDDPQGGILRLAQHSLRRLQGLVMAVGTTKNDTGRIFEMTGQHLASRMDRNIYISKPQENSTDPVIATALALANTPRGHALHIYPWDPAESFILHLLSPDLLLLDGTGMHMPQASDLLRCMKKEATLFVLIHEEQKEQWQKLATAAARTVKLVIVTETGPDHTAVWEHILAILSQHISGK